MISAVIIEVNTKAIGWVEKVRAEIAGKLKKVFDMGNGVLKSTEFSSGTSKILHRISNP